MNTTRRNALKSLALLSFAGRAAGAERENAVPPAHPLVGSWQVTSALTSLILSIEPHGEVLWIFIEGGGFSSSRRKWKPLPGGILIEGFPRYRLWQWKGPQRLRAEVEELPAELEVSKGFREFPQAFFMNRMEMHEMQFAPAFRDRALPKHWEAESVPEGWDQRAGKRRPSQQ